MGGLAAHLRRRIAAAGPLTVAEFMAAALGHPRHGYYMRRDPLGVAGDFITAPEISQIFGELIGLWCAVVWQEMGAPDPVVVVELGPGRGTLMADMLRAAATAPGFLGAARLHMVETSPVLRARQKEALAAALLGSARAWHDTFDGVPEGPMLLIANEFFDALPVHQYEMTTEGWRERLVSFEDGNCCPALAETPSALRRPGEVGDVFELALDWVPTPSFDTRFAYTYQDFVFEEFTTSGSDFAGNDEPGAPPHRFFAAVNFAAPFGLRSGATVRWVDEFTLNNANTVFNWSYTVVDLRFGFDSLFGNTNIRPFVGIDNAFDERYNSSGITNAFGGRYYEPSPGREVYVGFTIGVGVI